MAETRTTIPFKITAADTDSTEVIIAPPRGLKPDPNGGVLIRIIVESGTFTFNVGGNAVAASASVPSYTSATTPPLMLTVYPNTENLFFKAANASEVFRVEI